MSATNLQCPICCEKYDPSFDSRYPVLMKCCGNSLCRICAERDFCARKRRRTSLEAGNTNKEGIRCLYCNVPHRREYECDETSRPYVLNRIVAELVSTGPTRTASESAGGVSVASGVRAGGYGGGSKVETRGAKRRRLKAIQIGGKSEPLLPSSGSFVSPQPLTHLRNSYMDEQDEVNDRMRAILVDWLVEVNWKSGYSQETLYLSVNILDRYCSKNNVKRSMFQLIGITSYLIACKHNEISPPNEEHCVYLTDNAFDRQQVLDMEASILKDLKCNVTMPTAYSSLCRYLALIEASQLTRHAADYYLERTLQEYELLHYRPELVCAAAVVLALNNPDVRVRERSKTAKKVNKSKPLPPIPSASSVAIIDDVASTDEATTRDSSDDNDDESSEDLSTEDDEDLGPKLVGLPKILLDEINCDAFELLHVAKLVAKNVGEEPITASGKRLQAVKRKYERKVHMKVSSEVKPPKYSNLVENLNQTTEPAKM